MRKTIRKSNNSYLFCDEIESVWHYPNDVHRDYIEKLFIKFFCWTNSILRSSLDLANEWYAFHFEFSFQLIVDSVADDPVATTVDDAMNNAPDGQRAAAVIAFMEDNMKKCNPAAADKIPKYTAIVQDENFTQQLNEKNRNFASIVKGFLNNYCKSRYNDIGE